MADASFRVLKELFEKHLHFTPTAAEIAQFEADLAVVSPSLMRAALLEIEATNPVKSGRAKDWRDAVYAVYNRKVAEHAQLFPLFHSFETAFRSTVAVTLEGHYHDPKWWGPSNDAYRRGGDAKSVKAIGPDNIRTTSEQAAAIYYLVANLTAKKLNPNMISDGYQLLEHADLSHILALVDRHWSTFSSLFIRDGRRLSRADFFAKFEKIRAARNDVYHHKSFAGFTDVYKIAEELLAFLNFPLKRIHERIANSRCASPPYLGLIS